MPFFFFLKVFFRPTAVKVLLLDRIRSHSNVPFVRWMLLRACREEPAQSCWEQGTGTPTPLSPQRPLETHPCRCGKAGRAGCSPHCPEPRFKPRWCPSAHLMGFIFGEGGLGASADAAALLAQGRWLLCRAPASISGSPWSWGST